MTLTEAIASMCANPKNGTYSLGIERRRRKSPGTNKFNTSYGPYAPTYGGYSSPPIVGRVVFVDGVATKAYAVSWVATKAERAEIEAYDFGRDV